MRRRDRPTFDPVSQARSLDHRSWWLTDACHGAAAGLLLVPCLAGGLHAATGLPLGVAGLSVWLVALLGLLWVVARRRR